MEREAIRSALPVRGRPTWCAQVNDSKQAKKSLSAEAARTHGPMEKRDYIIHGGERMQISNANF